MGPKHGLQNAAVWTAESAVVLLDGVEANEQGKRLAEARLRALHPLSQGEQHYSTDFEKRVRKIFDDESEDRTQPWLTPEFWQHEIDNVLVQEIFGRMGSKYGGVERVCFVWPKLSTTWLRKRMEEVARAGLPQWVQNDFWAAKVDPILLVGIDRGDRFQSEAVKSVLKTCSGLRTGVVWVRVRALRNRRIREREAVSFADALEGSKGVDEGGSAVKETPPCFGCFTDRDVWKAADPILLRGIREASRCEREAVDKVLSGFPELRIGAIWARLRRLRYRQRTTGTRQWTNELDERLIQVYQEAGLSASVSEIQNLTDWPRRAIARRAHKLGLPVQSVSERRRWTNAEFRFAIESVNHLSVREIAEELKRSEKAVWDVLGHRGIPARFQDGCGVRELSEKLHVRRPSIRNWIKAGLLHRKRNGRISEDSLQSFLYRHQERINWPLLDEDTTFWVSELLEAERIRVNGSGTRTRANSRSSEKTQGPDAPNSHGTASRTLVADPYEDPASRRIQARAASLR